MDNIDLSSLEAEKQALMEQNASLMSSVAPSMFQDRRDNNVEFQLDNSNLIRQVQRLYRGDILSINKNGEEYWARQTDANQRLFNDFGVNELLTILSPYLDKLNALSIYKEERIYEILADLGEALTKYIHNNYDKLGMDTQYKKSKYDLIVISTLHAVESNFRKSLGGRTSENINTNKLYTNPSQSNTEQTRQLKKPFNLFNVKTW